MSYNFISQLYFDNAGRGKNLFVMMIKRNFGYRYQDFVFHTWPYQIQHYSPSSV